ncbi:uncharacterized protein LOC123306736 [Coccinella septempunctata]|uniref:uncharacterized protein LOC123306736 n=1 Tax=Coccinella septempunctata TaxID=41139 RepID=UPI001D0984DC|nr:uncharacterized protein LOC123306736 [Coccinella septempunctata]
MAIAHKESSFKLIISLLLVFSYIGYTALEATPQPENHLISTLVEKPESKTKNNNTQLQKKAKPENLENLLTFPDVFTKIQIQRMPGKNSSPKARKNKCKIVVDDLKTNSLAKYLDNFCRRSENFEYSEGTTANNSEKCELVKENEHKYIITTRDSKNNYRSDLLDRICGNFSLLKSSELNNIFGSSFCLRIAEYYIAYQDRKCCVGSFSFIPEDALQTEAVLIWAKQSGFSYVILSFYILSFVSLCIIFVSGLVSRKYRAERGNQILIHFAFSMFAQFVLHNAACWINVTPLLCNLHSMLSQYFTLVESCWTSIIAYLQFKRFVRVFDKEPNHLILKLCGIAYVFPILPISLWMIYHKTDTQMMNYLTFGLPEFLILLINSTLLILITRNIVFVKNEYIEHKKSLSMEVKLIFFLFFVLDFSWFLIILADLTASVFFIYLFIITQSLQGFMLFFVFGIMNDHNRLIYKKFLSIYSKKILLR